MMVVAVIIGSGGLAAFLKFHTRIAMTERDTGEAKDKIENQGKSQAVTDVRVALLEGTMKDIRDGLKALEARFDVVNHIKGAVEVIAARLEDARKENASVKADLGAFVASVNKERVMASRKARPSSRKARKRKR